MNKRVFGKKLSRTKNERRLLFRNLVREFIDHGSVSMTFTKAKAVAPLIEKLVTKAKAGNEQSRREIEAVVTDRKLVAKLMDDVKVRFAKRSSGYTRILKTGTRRGDAAVRVLLTYTDPLPVMGEIMQKKSTEKEKKQVIAKPKEVKKSKRSKTK